jgi:hypothetical protein
VNLGETNFEDGFAFPGWLLEEFPESYFAGELWDGRGNRIPGRNRIITDSTHTRGLHKLGSVFWAGWLAG